MSLDPNRCDPAFYSLLESYGLDAVETHSGTVIGLWPDLSVAYVNPAWTTFAMENGAGHADWVGHPVGRLLLYDIPPVLWRFFRENYARCLHEARPWEHRYECSSPDLERHFQMTVYPLGESEGLLSIHSLLVETPHAGPELPPVENRYRIDPEGYFIQCCHCRRFQRTGQENSWDWIPKWVEAPPPNTSHGFCPPCFRFYYHEDRILNNEFPESFRTGNDPSGSDP